MFVNDIQTNNKLFLVLTHYSIEKPTSPWYLQNGRNTGIGNMLFQIASCTSFAIKNNAQLYVPGLESFFKFENVFKKNSIFRNINSECPNEFFDNNYLHINENNWTHNIWEYTYSNNMKFSTFYFENWKNFIDYREIILKLFRPLHEDCLYISNKYPEIFNPNTCSIHVRLGPDYKEIYKNDINRLNELQNGYFKSLDHMIENKYIDTCFVFTNDPEYCKNIFDQNSKYSNIKFIYSKERDFVDVWMISLIKNNIVSVSTLAWWGSFLNENPDQYIVCCKGNRDDLHYPGWIVI
jgi:hypothetical protein